VASSGGAGQQDAAAMLSQLLNTLPLLFFTLDARNTLALVSKQAAAFWGLRQSDLEGVSLAHFFIRIGYPDMYEATAKLLRKKAPARITFFAGRQQKWLDVTATPIPPAGTLVCFTDITGHKRQEEALMVAVQEAQETERKRISEGLHNGVAQLLYAAKLKLDQISWDKEPNRLADFKKQVDHFLLEAISETRRISHELMPGILGDVGLEAAIEDIGRKLSNANLNLQCQVYRLDHPVEKHLQLAIYRIIQELANNIVKHAGASKASIQIRQKKDSLVLLAEDNGVGFGLKPDHPPGIGLKAIRDRVNLLQGTMEIDSQPNKGTLISIYLPLTLGGNPLFYPTGSTSP
jgi:PAS domain S-box-containing protein